MKSLEEQLAMAIELAALKHKGQKDKAGAPYILHPMSVAERVSTLEEKIVAWLHDIVEDTDVTLVDLENLGFSRKIVEAIRCITKTSKETYEEYLYKVRQNDIARDVKLSDLKHNMSVSRLQTPTKRDFNRIRKYKRAYEFLVKE